MWVCVCVCECVCVNVSVCVNVCVCEELSSNLRGNKEWETSECEIGKGWNVNGRKKNLIRKNCNLAQAWRTKSVKASTTFLSNTHTQTHTHLQINGDRKRDLFVMFVVNRNKNPLKVKRRSWFSTFFFDPRLKFSSRRTYSKRMGKVNAQIHRHTCNTSSALGKCVLLNRTHLYFSNVIFVFVIFLLNSIFKETYRLIRKIKQMFNWKKTITVNENQKLARTYSVFSYWSKRPFK